MRDTGLFKLYFGFALASLGMGLEYERLSIAYWERVAAQPPEGVPGA